MLKLPQIRSNTRYAAGPELETFGTPATLPKKRFWELPLLAYTHHNSGIQLRIITVHFLRPTCE